MKAEAEHHLAISALKAYMMYCVQNERMEDAREAEVRLTALEEMSTQEFAERYPDYELDSE